ncbi:MAG TPA: hypothetical protein VFC38_08395 [Stellaceae bacterium]|nr:hypothetical protein [Stellaceae bacterium]
MAAIASLTLARSRFGVSLPVLVALVAFATVLASGATLLGDPDTFWHIVAGRWIIAHHAVPRIDIFSNSVPGTPWVAHEWLAETVFAPLYDRFGWNGPVLATALAFAASLAILTRALLRWLEPVHALAFMATSWAMALPHLLTRPHVLALPILIFWFAALAQARSNARAPSLWLAPLMALWANLHGGYVVGLVFAGLFAGEAVLLAPGRAARLVALRRWAPFVGLSILAALATPHFLEGLYFPFQLIRMKFALSVLVEWQSPNFQTIQPLEIWLMLALALTFGFGVRLPPTRIAMLLLLLHMSLAHQRHAELLGLVAPLLVAEPIAELLRRRRAVAASALDETFAALAGRAGVFGCVGVGLFAAALGLVFLAHPLLRKPDGYAPAAALDAAKAAHLRGPVFNDYDFGGYLIFSGVAPFIDGRADMYGDAFIKRYVEATRGINDDLPKLLDDYHIAWTLLGANTTAATLMAHRPGWSRLYADDTAIIDVRDSAAP